MSSNQKPSRKRLMLLGIGGLTLAGLHFAALLGGAAVTETLFGWPGLGRLTLEAVMSRDYNLLLGILLLSSMLVVVINITVDLLQAFNQT